MELPKRMKAVKWEGKLESVSVKNIDTPKIQHPLDIIVRVTSAAICGTDLHTYHGRFDTKVGLTFGHENLGIVEQIGSGITTLKKGDRVLISDVDSEIDSHGHIIIDAAFGFGGFGDTPQMNGGQAEFMRVPNAHVNTLVLPAGDEHELDYLLLADIWPTAWFALDAAGQILGDTVVVFGAGPVGLLCAFSAKLRGALRVYSVDRIPERLARAKSIGAIPINFAHGDPVAQILALEPNGVDRTCDCVGFECVNSEGKNIENLIITQAINVTRVGGGIGLIGPYKQTQDLLKRLIERDDAKPSFVFDRVFKIESAADAYREFSDHKITKAVFQF
ncbi:putative S-glutathione dehydrogenase [Xylogone sp. PMI_703]|nr:putative S-glutathione dehydrogenase [Xylogone sp. PMI_703]